MKHAILFLSVTFVTFAGLSGSAYASSTTKSFEFGKGTANESSNFRTFIVPCRMTVTAVVKFKRLGDVGASDDVPIVIELRNPPRSSAEEEGSRSNWEEAVAKRSLQTMTLIGAWISYGCQLRWSVRVRTKQGKSPVAITGDITVSFNDSQYDVDIEGSQITLEEGNQVTKSIGDLGNGTITIKVNYLSKTARVKVELINRHGTVVASQTGRSSFTPSADRINLTYTNGDCHQGAWSIRFTNNGDEKLHEMVPKATFAPTCPT